jgi:hypothetical protein
LDDSDNHNKHHRGQVPTSVPRKRDKCKSTQKRLPDLEFDVSELEEENKQLKLELKGKKKHRRSSKEDLRQDNERTFDKANLGVK